MNSQQREPAANPDQQKAIDKLLRGTNPNPYAPQMLSAAEACQRDINRLIELTKNPDDGDPETLKNLEKLVFRLKQKANTYSIG